MQRLRNFFRLVVVVLVFAAWSSWVAPRAKADATIDQLQQTINDLKSKLSDAQQQSQTLSSAIKYLDSKILLNQKQIEQTVYEIKTLQAQVSDLGQRVSGLEVSLNDLSATLVARIQDQYKHSSTEALSRIFATTGLTSLFKQAKYMEQVRSHTQELLLTTEMKRQLYDQEKANKEQKQKEVQALQDKLQSQQNDLHAQQAQKTQLLADTRGNEVTYQRLLAAAQAQLESFSAFAKNAGGSGLLSNQTSCDDWGCYYNQRDTQWGGLPLNGTKYTIASDGCLVTSMAMVLTHYGHRSVNPISINLNPSNFASYYPAYMLYTIHVDGVTAARIGASIDSILSSGNPVVVGVHAYGGTHFVVLKSGSNGSYQMRDPYLPNGKDVNFTDHYSVKSIYEINKVVVN